MATETRPFLHPHRHTKTSSPPLLLLQGAVSVILDSLHISSSHFPGGQYIIQGSWYLFFFFMLRLWAGFSRRYGQVTVKFRSVWLVSPPFDPLCCGGEKRGFQKQDVIVLTFRELFVSVCLYVRFLFFSGKENVSSFSIRLFVCLFSLS